MKITVKRIVTAVMLTGSVITVYQVLSKPQPVADPLTPEIARSSALSFDQKLQELSAPHSSGSKPAEVHFTSDEVSAEVAQSLAPAATPAAQPANSQPATPDSVVAAGSVNVQSYQVKLDGDMARGQFLAEIAGKDVYVTLAGHLGSQGGYVTFDPTEFKVGDLSIPVSLVNPALQKKLAEQRDQLKLPEGVASLRIENSELVITQK
jgi:hypothetical protein